MRTSQQSVKLESPDKKKSFREFLDQTELGNVSRIEGKKIETFLYDRKALGETKNRSVI